jgi:tRNA(Ile)-lysidine synthetase-like protein
MEPLILGPHGHRLAPVMALYPRPQHMGGILIREAVRVWKAARPTSAPRQTTSQILCAVSGGPDSLALAHLLIHYGRNVAPRERISLLHVNHGWRGEESDADESYVRKCSEIWDVPLEVVRLNPRAMTRGDSWEDAARRERKKIYNRLSERKKALVFTAHHADDVAETLLWRLFTGAARTHGAGILEREGSEFRPFLRIRKSQLVTYLLEEKLEWRTDPTNLEGRFLRSRMRKDLMPLVEALFPQAVQHLVKLGEQAARKEPEETGEGYELGSVFFRLVDGRIRRAHWEALETLQRKSRGEIHLPNGWKLKRETVSERKGGGHERWTIERPSPKADDEK